MGRFNLSHVLNVHFGEYLMIDDAIKLYERIN